MCGLAGIVHLDGHEVPQLRRRLAVMNSLIAHRGPDGDAIWAETDLSAGLAHRRLAIIDLSSAGAQPMTSPRGSVLVHNGEIYNYLELREALQATYPFRGHSDSEVILAAHSKWGDDAVMKFRGMWAFAIWDPAHRRLFASRDWFGIKPLFYAQVGRVLYFASEAKALLPFLPEIVTDADSLAEYVAFQLPLGDQTLFKHIRQVPPGSVLIVEKGRALVKSIWRPEYKVDTGLTAASVRERFTGLMQESLRLHLRADVPIGAYLSGGVDSSLIAILSSEQSEHNRSFFHGKFVCHPGYDESAFAAEAAAHAKGTLHQIAIAATDFESHIEQVLYHLDFPLAGPGSFPQYMVSKLCGSHVKVVLGGQGGDEIFGGYQRYLIGYLGQALLEAVEGEQLLPISLAELAPQLKSLREYKPLLAQAFEGHLFEKIEDRYLRLVDRSADLQQEIDLPALPIAAARERFTDGFNAPGIATHSPFDRMMRWDVQRLLPALLQVEDRMGMAHGLESRVPFLDRPLFEFVASIPSELKMPGGRMKHLLKDTFGAHLPSSLLKRRDKMGFPVPLREWFQGPLREFVHDVFTSNSARQRSWVRGDEVLQGLDQISAHSRKIWGLLSLELWQRQFHDRSSHFAKIIERIPQEQGDD